MNYKNIRVAVMGAGHEAAEFLKQLYSDITIVVFCADHSNLSSANESIEFCKQNEIPVIHTYTDIDQYAPDYIFMVSYPPLISSAYLSKYHFINMHAALLPRFRGFHGGVWAVINGEKYHGFTIHKVDEGIDSGPIYFQAKTEMAIDDDIISLRKKITELYDSNIKSVFLKIISGDLKADVQDETKALYVCKRKSYDGEINWSDEAWNVYNLIRALVPPYTKGAFTHWKGSALYITKAAWADGESYISTPGQVVAKLKGHGVLVKCADKVLLINSVSYLDNHYRADEFFKTVGARFKPSAE